MVEDGEFSDRWFWDGYLDWACIIDKYRSDDPTDATHVPTFLAVRPEHADLTPDDVVRLFENDRLLQDFHARFESHELDLAKVLSEKVEAEIFAYLDLSALANASLRRHLETVFIITEVGLPVALAEKRASRDFSIWPVVPDGPIVASIDDGIGFLNERFTRVDPMAGGLGTRFAGLWLQGRHKASAAGSSVFLGRTLDASEINDLLGKGRRLVEAEEYAALNADLYEADARRTTEFGFTHGTHVLDVAAGADPNLPVGCHETSAWPLLAVQLPPEAIADTSGKRFEIFAILALRWILAVAASVSAAPLVVNISLGVLAGPKNGRKFFEYRTARDVRLWSDSTGRDVRVVFAYGNSLRTRQVARYPELEPNAPATVEWVIQPDDFTPSFVEIHLPARDHLPELAVGLAAPDGRVIAPLAIPPGKLRLLFGSDGAPYAAIYHVPSRPLNAAGTERTPARYDVAVAPTAARDRGELVGPSGAWSITLVNQEAEALDVVLQIQRDDTSPGYPTRGRQSYFDGPDADAFDPATGEFGGLSTGPLTRDGTNNALATGRVDDAAGNLLVLSVGAAARSRGAKVPVPSRYASRGASWSSGPPDLSAISDDGFATAGVLASGTFSGSVVELNGSSVAAPKVTRRLAQELTGSNRPHKLGDTHDAVDLPQHRPQLSAEVLLEPAGARERAPS